MTHDTDRKDDGLDPFETWFASMSRADQQTYFPYSYAMRKAWNEALRRVSSVGGEEIISAVKYRLREHYLTGIHCDHERKTDRASCSCSIWRGEEKPSVDAAVQDWIEHAMPLLPARLRPTPPTSGEGELRAIDAAHHAFFESICGRQPRPHFDDMLPPRRNSDARNSIAAALTAYKRSLPTQPQANAGLVEVAKKARPFIEHATVCGHPRSQERAADLLKQLDCAPSVQEAEVAGEKPDEGHPHLIRGEFQSDKYPTTPRGKVPLSVKDKTAQDLLWTYAQRRRAVDAEFAADLEIALRSQGYKPPTPADSEELREQIECCLENARTYMDGFDGKNDLSVGPHMLREMLGTAVELLSRLSPQDGVKARKAEAAGGDFKNPRFEYQNLDDADGPSFWWNNPFKDGRREKIASLWWPHHDPDDTGAVENLFDNLELRLKHSEAHTPDVNVGLLAAAKAAAKALEWEIGGGENPFHSKSLAAFEQLIKAIATVESASGKVNND